MRMKKLALMSYFTGWILITAGMVIAAVFFKTPAGGSYSPLNHFVSELGWGRFSPMAWVYNSCLSVGSLMFIPMLWTQGRQSNTSLRHIAMLSGICAVLACCAAGILPMDMMIPHLIAASVIFLGWFLAVLLFTFSYFRDRKDRIPYAIMAAGIVAIAVSVGLFFAFADPRCISFLKTPDSFSRPRFWLPPFMEWCFFLSLFLWGLTVSGFVEWLERYGLH